MGTGHRVTVAALLLVGIGAAAGAQSTTILVRIVDDASLAPLQNAEVSDLASGQHRFTNGQGEARLAWPSIGILNLRIRQLGYRLAERRIERIRMTTVGPDSLTIALARVAFTLPKVFTTARRDCDTETDLDARLLSASVLEQLRLSAERYERFRKAYPFKVHVIRRTAQMARDGVTPRLTEGKESARSEEWGDPYRPGRVVEPSAIGFSVPILFLANLADSAFWEHHCFAVRGVETVGERRLMRLSFSPTRNTKEPDWSGTALIDSATSNLTRIEFELSLLGENDRPRRLEGHTTFMSPSPFIVVPESTIAMWWRRGPLPDGSWAGPDVAQLIAVTNLEYRKQRPP
jgi:hypothetical protein